MTRRENHPDLEDPLFLSSQDALRVVEDSICRRENCIQSLHERTFASLPTGDEVFTDKRAAVWSEPMKATMLPLGGVAIVKSIYREDI